MTHKTKTAGAAAAPTMVATPTTFGALAMKEPKQDVQQSEINKEIAEQFDHTAVGLIHLLFVSINFLAVGAVAAGLGFCLHWAHAHWTWMNGWMFDVGHVVEGIIYVADCVNLVVGVAKMLKKSFADF